MGFFYICKMASLYWITAKVWMSEHPSPLCTYPQEVSWGCVSSYPAGHECHGGPDSGEPSSTAATNKRIDRKWTNTTYIYVISYSVIVSFSIQLFKFRIKIVLNKMSDTELSDSSWVLLHKSHNATVPYPTMHHFVTEMCTSVHISVTKWCIVGYLSSCIVEFGRWV